ncbi:MAG: ketol-acid reductoisomerase [Bryobacteraceae bacterium]
MKVFYEKDADLSVLKGKTIAVIGYGNQGRAQALNLRDSQLAVVVGNIDDAYRKTAIEDGFSPVSIEEAVSQGDIVMILIPDEVQPGVYQQSVAPHLSAGKVLSFASGYNIRFSLIAPPKDVDVIMMAPRTIGRQVRIAYENGSGVNADVDVWQDASGAAWPVTLALAKGTGCTRAGAFHTSFATETDLDLFSEQGLWPAFFDCLLTSFELLVEKGYPAEAVALELYASAEAADIFLAMAKRGIFEQMRFHSPTSQYGVLSRRIDSTGSSLALRKRMEETLTKIQNGEFSREWTREQADGYPSFNRLREEAYSHPLNEADREVRRLLELSVGG